MKNKTKRFFISTLSIIMIVIITISVSATLISNAEAAKTEKAILLEMENQKQAVAADNALMEYYFKDGEGIVYPDYFAGRYIEDGIYYLCLNNPPEGIEETYNTLFGDNKEKVVYLYKDYSYNELMKQAESLADSICDMGIDFISYSINNKNGNIDIGVLNENVNTVKNSIATIKSRELQTPVINIQAAEPIELQSAVNCGEPISTDVSLSMGVYGEYQGQTAFVTAGHGGDVGDTVYGRGKNIGNIVFSRYTNGGQGDFAIGLFSNTHISSISHTIDGSSETVVLTNGTINQPSVGTILKKYGAYSGYSTSTVIQTDASFTVSSVTVHGLTKARLTSGSTTGGDSGGPYMVGNAFCGIHHGMSVGTDGIISVYFTPYSIIRAQGFTAYANHQGTSWINVNSGFHQGYCSICEETVLEPHYLYVASGSNTCSRCGSSSIDIPSAYSNNQIYIN